MLTFTTITQKTVCAKFEHEVDGYRVNGSATYNKESKLTGATASVQTADGLHIGNFNVYSVEKDLRINLSECSVEKMEDALSVSKDTLEALSSTYPK